MNESIIMKLSNFFDLFALQIAGTILAIFILILILNGWDGNFLR